MTTSTETLSLPDILQTPDAEKSINTTMLKRKSPIFVDGDKVTYIEEDADVQGNFGNKQETQKKQMVLKEVKKENVSCILQL